MYADGYVPGGVSTAPLAVLGTQGEDGEYSQVYRVYMHVQNGRYNIHLDNNMVRMFNDNTLPDSIKVSTGLVNAHTWPETTMLHPGMILYQFNDRYPKEMFNIGWRDGPHYCLVLDKNIVSDLTLSGGWT